MAGRVVRQHDNYFVTHDSSISAPTTVPFRPPRQFHFVTHDSSISSPTTVPTLFPILGFPVIAFPAFLVTDHCVRYSTCDTEEEGAGLIYQGSVFWCAIVVGYVVLIHASAGSRL
ncbi:hypothetical protein KC19_4G187300 [Ceratodon purpureus]|uniref:Uncharacterized protein n=1 Tax=Ceratodon purpureus TaxID=3225 RepID=A0A8T0IDR8_CERPU|nr:hypothetical protein KC19_4G187300 [Ceratodon purpureus]